MNDLINNLKSNNLKVTPQRLAIYGYLMSTDKHPSAETIYNDLKCDYPNMSLATVYKTVASLKSAGLVMELNAGEDNFRYDAKTVPHAHIVCNVCHRIDDYFGETMQEDIAETVEQKTGFAIDSRQVYFFGLCDKCRESNY